MSRVYRENCRRKRFVTIDQVNKQFRQPAISNHKLARNIRVCHELLLLLNAYDSTQSLWKNRSHNLTVENRTELKDFDDNPLSCNWCCSNVSQTACSGFIYIFYSSRRQKITTNNKIKYKKGHQKDRNIAVNSASSGT